MKLLNVSSYINKEKRDNIRKRLYEIENTRNIDRKLKNRLLKELESMSIDLKFTQKPMISAYRDDNYANINDIEYIFGDIDNYYAPVLSSSLFNNGYQKYHFRDDPMRNMSVKEYLSEIEPFLRQLIPRNKHDMYCFMHAITITLYHNELCTNPERISKKLLTYAQKLNWHEIDFPACFADYAIFEKLNEDIALNVLYVPFNEVNICPEYIYLNVILLLKIK